jgi:predicted dehydrogenase
MGKHHARIYNALPGVELVGISDVDDELVTTVAGEYGVEALSQDELLRRVEAVSIAVPTAFHSDIAEAALRADVDILVEKPFVQSPANGKQLIRLADKHDRILQVGHIERFNPAVLALEDILAGKELIALSAERLGPPTDREIDDSAVVDLMIHDIDIVLLLADGTPQSVLSAGVRNDRHATATLVFADDVVAELTASRLTQKKIRTLDIITETCLIQVDYIDRSIEVHYASAPEYIRTDDDIRYRHESVVERPMVESAEPLRTELSAFVSAVRDRTPPVVTGEDGLEALQIATQIDEASTAAAHDIDIATMSEVHLD